MLDSLYHMTFKLFCNRIFGVKFDKFNNKGARMLDSLYHTTFKLFCNRILRVKTSLLPCFTQRYNECRYVTL